MPPSHSPRATQTPALRRSRLRIHRRRSPLAAFFPLLRWLALTSLCLAIVIGVVRFVLFPPSAGALEFTPHVVGGATQAVGVLDIKTSDIDNDGDVDIVTAGLDGVKVYINQGNKKFEQKIIDGEAPGERVQVIDFDRDGLPDLLVTLKGVSPSVKWYHNTGNVEFHGTSIGTGKDAKAYAGDLDGDTFPDVVSATDEGGQIVLRRWMNNGSGSFTSTTLDSNSKVTAVAIGDVDGNQYPDIVTLGGKGLIMWRTMDGLTWNRFDIDDSSPDRTTLTIGDLDKDGKTDIVTGTQDTNSIVFYQNIDNQAWKRIPLADGADATNIVIRDLDEDGNEDIIANSQDENTIYWFRNDGQENFTREAIATNLQSVFSVAVADLDNDNDFDFVAGDHFRGTVYWYERVRVKPVATAPTNIQQTIDGSGRVSFDVTVSDGDRDPTRMRLQYSRDGKNWYKPWLLKATPSAGSVDLKNSNGYQVGSQNAIDTDKNDSVTLTFLWDTKSIENTGGPFSGDVAGVRLRVIPRDQLGNGLAATSGEFRIDQKPPEGLRNFHISSITEQEAALSWTRPTDSSAFFYRVYYGTKEEDVRNQVSDVWDPEKDDALGDQETSSTTITGLTAGKTYFFKLVATDQFGNSAATSTIHGTATTTTPVSPTPEVSASPEPTVPPEVSPESSPLVSPSLAPQATPSVTPSPSAPPSTLQDNHAPVADAGQDQVVNPSALVILDGTASTDPDQDILSYVWRQISGPQVDILSERTATPSFSAGKESETYIFALTVRDPRGASATDTVTVATRALPVATTTPVQVNPSVPPPSPVAVQSSPSPLASVLRLLDFALLVLSVLATILSLAERLLRRVGQRRAPLVLSPEEERASQGKLVHYQTGQPVTGAMVLVYSGEGKLRATQRTNAQGAFGTLFPPGQYTLTVEAPGFAIAGAVGNTIHPTNGILYTGGMLTVKDGKKPISLVIPLKPVGKEISSARTRALHIWQAVQHLGRILSWPIFVLGALLNTALVFIAPSSIYLIIEVLYIVLVIMKIALEVRMRPAYGLVRDAITHIPLDLAVVRLFEQDSNRLIMTRVTNAQGKFFALPPAGKYTITVTKPGYGVFSKDKVEIAGDQDSTLQLTADLMPIAPAGGLARAQAAVL